MASDKERITLLEYRMEQMEKSASLLTQSFLKVSEDLAAQQEKSLYVDIMIGAINRILSREIPTFAEELRQVAATIISDAHSKATDSR